MGVMISTLMRQYAAIFAPICLGMYLVAACLPLVLCQEMDGSQQVETQFSAACRGMFIPGRQAGEVSSVSHAICDGTYGCHDSPVVGAHLPAVKFHGHTISVPFAAKVPGILATPNANVTGVESRLTANFANFSPSMQALRAHRTVVLTC
jgi:hypothetical protein